MDLVVLLANLFLMRMLTRQFVGALKAAAAGDHVATFVIFLTCASLMFLAPIGATLKRWHFHERLSGKQVDDADEMASGCLFNPIFYICTTFLIFFTIHAFVMQYFYGDDDPGAGVFLASMFTGIGLVIVHTWLVYRYFSPPKHPPELAFLRDPRSEILGDVLIFTNMLIFQLFWNLISYYAPPRPDGLFDVFSRLVMLFFIALLIYFPPRIFYLVEDAKKRRTWVMILLANSPVIFRLLVGTTPNGGW
jgi:hypothetical protein